MYGWVVDPPMADLRRTCKVQKFVDNEWSYCGNKVDEPVVTILDNHCCDECYEVIR